MDNIFPVDPQDGLVKGEMQKLTYYALTNPRKLDRIGNYLAEYLKYYVDHRRYDFAKIAMKAMEQFCDVEIIVQGEHILCHKVVLASASEYFENMFR